MQDAVQGFHWENSQATLHPLVAYFRSSNGDLKHTSICVISDCLKHDQTAVHCFLTKVVTLIKQKVSNIKIIHYYSDGAPSQYKNYKGLVNLCHHRLDHSIDVVWNFFATSHGKSACDGMAGTVKRLATNASLMATEENHILMPLDLFDWASKNIRNIDFIYISAEEITEHLQFKKVAEVSPNDQFTPGKYIACVYDDECYIALIHEYSHENRDVRV